MEQILPNFAKSQDVGPCRESASIFLVANLASVHQQWRDAKLDADQCPLCHPLLSLVGKRIFQS